MEIISLFLFLAVCGVLLLGYPVAFSLAGTALIFALIGVITGNFDPSFLSAFPSRIFGIMTNQTLIAVPLFVLMGVVLERSRIAENLLETMSKLFGKYRGGLAISVTLVGALLAASTGIVGATVVTMGLMSLPTMLKKGYKPELAAGTICATGTLGQIIPPSIALVLLGDVLSNAYQQAQLNMGIFTPKTVSVGDLFMGAFIPGLLLVVLYLIYILTIAFLKPEYAPALSEQELESENLFKEVLSSLAPPLVLIVLVLGSIIGGFATPTEAASVGAFGAIVLALIKKQLSFVIMKDVLQSATQVTSMVFMILIGAALFSIVFRGFGGDEVIREFFETLPGGVFTACLLVMLVIFLLGFILDFIEITFVVIPIVGPILLAMGVDPIWLGIMIAINLQTSFLTPPFGFALFYLRGVAPAGLTTQEIYRGVIPFIGIQLFVLSLIAAFPAIATWLPGVLK
jgi:tripartite ATP-independent transporter DctM subunit